MKGLLNKFVNLGIRKEYQLWEQFLTRKINAISLIALVNVSLSYFIFPGIGLTDFQNILLLSICMSPVVIILNSFVHYKAGVYSFFIFGAVLMGYISVKLGLDSLFFIFFFPIFLSVVQLLGRKEMLWHMIIILLIYCLTIIWVLLQISNPEIQIKMSDDTLTKIRVFDILLAAFTAVAFIVLITIESMKHERLLNAAIKEKDILMAEVFHRVKNNMNIVTSLLNLKKENSSNIEVREAIEDCRNRVYSMALVHQKIFQKKSVTDLDFTDYVKELILDITQSLGKPGDEKIIVVGNQMNLPLNQAIPCGLIINELITNSYKHARLEERSLKIIVELQFDGIKHHVKYLDNGPGLPHNVKKDGSLGLELIYSLSDQIDANIEFQNKNGLHFTMRF